MEAMKILLGPTISKNIFQLSQVVPSPLYSDDQFSYYSWTNKDKQDRRYSNPKACNALCSKCYDFCDKSEPCWLLRCQQSKGLN